MKRITMVDRLTDELRSQIINRTLTAGTQITEDSMASLMEVSRATMRQALARLEVEGLLERSSTNRILRVTKLTVEDIASTYRARRVLELAGVEAAAHASEERLREFPRVLGRIESAVEGDGVESQVHSDFAMHEALVGLLDSPDLLALERQLLTRLRLASIGIAVDDDWQQLVRENRKLCDLIVARNIEAAKDELEARLLRSEQLVVGAYEV